MNFIYKGIKFRWSFRKFLINIVICSLIFSVSFIYFSDIVKATPKKTINIITVRNGDTLWSIARNISSKSDPRAVIDQIKKDNNLQNSRLAVGQTLKITKLID